MKDIGRNLHKLKFQRRNYQFHNEEFIKFSIFMLQEMPKFQIGNIFTITCETFISVI